MTDHRLAVYYAWDRASETAAPLGVIENRFPTLFESRRQLYPHFRELSDPQRYDQGIAGFLDQILKRNFTAFIERASALTGHAVPQIERGGDDGRLIRLDTALLDSIDTLIVISFDSLRTDQQPDACELEAVGAFLAKPGNLLFVCPHHDIGEADDDLTDEERTDLQAGHFLHHGDRTIPPQQAFGGFARALLAGLGLPVENRFGLHPAAEPDGSPSPIEADRNCDRLGLLTGVTGFNLHPHLPHFERFGAAVEWLDVLARQPIDLHAPPHPFTRDGRSRFDALLQSRAGLFAGDLLIGDATLWSSTAGGLENLHRLWANLLLRDNNRC